MDWIAGPYFDHIAAFEVWYHSTLFEGGGPRLISDVSAKHTGPTHPQIKLSDTALQMQQCDQNMDTSDISLVPRPFVGETAYPGSNCIMI